MTTITLQLRAPQVGGPSPEFPAYGMKAYWSETGKLCVVATILRSDGGVLLIQDVIDPPAKEQL